MKVARGKKFYFRQLEEHQERALRMVGIGGGIYHKISDESRGAKPADAFYLSGRGVLVIYWEESKVFYFIDIKDYIKIKEASPESSGVEETVCQTNCFLKS